MKKLPGMKKLTLAVLALTATLYSHSSIAQSSKAKIAGSKTEEIVIRKTGKADKMTIVVDGENVTINGKPIDEYKTSDVTVLRRSTPPVPPIPPMPGNEFSFNMAANPALLGVLTEKADDGAKIKEVNKETAAEKAGLKKEDVITKVGTTPITSPQDLVEAIGKYKPNDKVSLTYKRDGKENKTTATLGENKNRNFNIDRRFFDLNMPDGAAPFLKDFDLHLNRKAKIGLEIQDMEVGKGVKVKGVDAESAAAKAGLQVGDIITQINGNDIEGVDDAREEIRGADDGTNVKITYNREGKTHTGEIVIPKKIKTADL